MPITVGILGFAHGHVGVYCEQWMKLVDQPIRLGAGWDHDQSRLESSCRKFNCAAVSIGELLNRTDAVLIGAETSMHADLVEQSAAAGKTIILQKPLALTIDQADRIVSAV